MENVKDDRILLSTRVVAALVVPFLVLAFIILYLFPETSGERFAWQIKPNMTAAFMGAGYLGGSWLFLNVVIGHRWHRVSTGFLPVAAFTAIMLLATILHWDRFDPSHVPFILWLVLYAVSPFLLPLLWWRNRVTDPGTPESNDAVVPPIARQVMAVLAVVLLLFAAAALLFPDFVAGLWPWQLTTLTARILGGWFVLLGVAGTIIARDSRWTTWRIGLESIAVWHILVLVAAALNPADFPGGVFNWYLISVAIAIVAMTVLYVMMERERRAAPVSE